VLDAQRERSLAQKIAVGGLRCWSSLFAASSPSAIADGDRWRDTGHFDVVGH
jgi:hypothetical protein